MPVTFSSTDSLRASYLWNTREKMGRTLKMIKNRPKPSSGIMTR